MDGVNARGLLGANLAAPTLPLSPTTRVLVQLVKDPVSGSQCWESNFLTAEINEDVKQLKAKLP